MRDGFTPNINRLKVKTNPQSLHVSESGVGLLQRNNTEYEMGRLHRPESFVTTTTEWEKKERDCLTLIVSCLRFIQVQNESGANARQKEMVLAKGS